MSESLKPLEILEIPEILVCTCPETDCDWHGKCKDCVALHRYHATIPNCLEIAIKKANASSSLDKQ